MKEIDLTPELATKWLEGNVHNRSVRDSVVDRYARDMKAGRWLFTHEAIAFDDHGMMIDGQHRCWAVIQSGATIRVLVARDASMETQAVIDTGLPRTMVDAMHLVYGRTEIQSMHVAVAKALAQGGPVRSGHALTHQELVTVLSQHEEAIQFAVKAFPKKVRFVTVAPVITVVARAFYTANRTLLVRFADILSSGKTHHTEEEAAILLRNWLLEKAPVRGHRMPMSQASAVYGKTERALASFLIGERLTTLYAATSELFPLPEETRAQKAAAKKRGTDYQNRLQVRLRKAERAEGKTNGGGAGARA